MKIKTWPNVRDLSVLILKNLTIHKNNKVKGIYKCVRNIILYALYYYIAVY